MRVCYFANGNLAELPSWSADGGAAVAALVASGGARYIDCDESFRGHVDAHHCCLTPENQLAMLPESDWPENQAQPDTREGGAA